MGRAGLTRRALLGLLALGGTAAAVRLVTGRDPGIDSGLDRLLDGVEVHRPDGERFLAPLLSSIYATRMSPEFGRRYLERSSGRADLDSLAAEVMARLEAVRPWRELAGPLAQRELDDRLRQAITADFLDEHGLCEIDGWYLAQTECRLAAMRYLASSGGDAPGLASDNMSRP
jgi:hypothetical protein